MQMTSCRCGETQFPILTEEELELIEKFRASQMFKKGFNRALQAAAAKLEEIAKTGTGGGGVVDGLTGMYIQTILKIDVNKFEF